MSNPSKSLLHSDDQQAGQVQKVKKVIQVQSQQVTITLVLQYRAGGVGGNAGQKQAKRACGQQVGVVVGPVNRVEGVVVVNFGVANQGNDDDEGDNDKIKKSAMTKHDL
ncbi:hypothetical protein EDB89DRAFT_1909286 [Lactarius sanguifluus]|nr:hypothetical protein EDB89DRAFT_1909286 [Lactarius sanguifluus]